MPTETNYTAELQQTNEITKFDELRALVGTDGTPVSLVWNDKKYEIATLQRPFGPSKEVIYGMWDVTDTTLRPVAFADCIFSENSVKISTASFRFAIGDSQFPTEFRDLYNLAGLEHSGDADDPNVGFAVDARYKKEGLGQLLNSVVLVTSEAMGAEKIVYDNDLTLKSLDDSGSHIQFKGENILVPEQQASFYGKYSTDVTIERRDGYGMFGAFDNTVSEMPTKISAMQESMLHEALGHYNSLQ